MTAGFKPRGCTSAVFVAAALFLPASAFASSIKTDEEVIFFPTIGHLDEDSKAWIVPVHGWIFEPEEASVWRAALVEELLEHLELEPEASDDERFRRCARMFLVNNERGKAMQIRIAGRTSILRRSDSNVHFAGTERLGRERLGVRGKDPWLPLEAVTQDGDPRRFRGQVQLLAPEGVSVNSDIDDTIKVSNVTDKRELLANTFLREFRAVPKMAETYERWLRQGAAFHYVTTSPWQLFPAFSAFMAAQAFPRGSVHPKTFRLKDQTSFDLFTAPEVSKVALIDTLMRTYPGRGFVLVGDTGERDLEIYGAIARHYPDRVMHVFLCEISPEDAESARLASAFKGVPESRWTLFWAPSALMRLDLHVVE
jgi:hypothetical protein